MIWAQPKPNATIWFELIWGNLIIFFNPNATIWFEIHMYVVRMSQYNNYNDQIFHAKSNNLIE